ncbi:MAG: MFS transporter [Candidatus Rokuibacteriota bacterium]|nr:MAG: MFS transporter [Candidatus Rokubacteria bacterium]
MSQRRLFYGWTVLAAAATIVAIGQGALLSFGVFLKPLEESMRWNRSDISMVALLNWLAMGAGSFVWGALSDRLGGRVVAVAGGLLMGLGFVVSSQATELWQLDVTFGLAVGFAAGAFLTPLSATATKWFTASRGLAVGVVSAGSGLGLLLFSPLARWLTNTWDWRIAMLVLGDLAWLVVIPAALLIRNAPSEMGAVALGGGAAPQREYSTAQVLRTPQFWAIALTHLACCATHAGPIFHMVTHAIDQGVLPMVAATALGVSGLSSIAGRIGCGVLADRFGAKRTLVAGLALQAVMVFSYLFTRHAGDFYAVAIVFGVAYGGVMPLYALVTREYFGEKVMGTAYGAVFFISTLGMGLGSWAGGFIHDHLGTYGWLYGGSAAIGAAATLMAFSFRSPRLMAQGATSS